VTKQLRLRGAGPGGHRPAQAGGAGSSDRIPTTSPATAAAAHLASRFGTETPAVLSMADGRPELLDPLVPGLHYLEAEAVYAVRHEMAGSVADVLDRRTRASLRDARGAAAAAHRVAALIGPELGWDQARMATEADGYADALRTVLARAGLDPEGGPPGPRPGPAVAAEPG
jgi:glycerol-3-phosphate dehydrogenase